jgi:hypothetical protein
MVNVGRLIPAAGHGTAIQVALEDSEPTGPAARAQGGHGWGVSPPPCAVVECDSVRQGPMHNLDSVRPDAAPERFLSLAAVERQIGAPALAFASA